MKLIAALLVTAAVGLSPRRSAPTALALRGGG